MADKKYRSLTAEITDDVIDTLFEMLVEIAQRLVENEHLGALYQSASEQSALELAAADGADSLIAVVSQLNEVEHGVEPVADVGTRQSGRRQRPWAMTSSTVTGKRESIWFF